MRSRLLPFLALLAFTAITPAKADDPMTTLRIEVKTRSEKPIDRASVIVRFSEGRSIIKAGKKIMTTWQLKTNQEGVAKIPPMPQGKILVQVIAKGYQTFGETFDVNEEEKTIVVRLNPPQPPHSEH